MNSGTSRGSSFPPRPSPYTVVTFDDLELVHILTLLASHDYTTCRRCDAIVTQLALASVARFNHPWGEGGDPPSNQGEAEGAPYHQSVDELFGETNL